MHEQTKLTTALEELEEEYELDQYLEVVDKQEEERKLKELQK
jgi:hypothetical protein